MMGPQLTTGINAWAREKEKIIADSNPQA